MMFQPLHQTEQPGLHMVLQIAVRKVFFHVPGGLGHIAENNDIPHVRGGQSALL